LFLIDSLHVAQSSESSDQRNSSRTIIRDVSHPDQISRMFGVITYRKVNLLSLLYIFAIILIPIIYINLIS